MVAPSALFDEDNEPPAISPLLGGAKSRYLRGALIHNLLELLPNVVPEIREDWAHNWVKNRNIDSDLKDDIVLQALKIINDDQFKDLFGINSRAEVAIVGKGKNLDDNIVVNGNIDRLVIKENEILVLDYKTNRPPPIDAADLPKVYINQMAAYRAVLQNQFPSHKITCALLWTDIPLLMEISGEVMDIAVTTIKHI
jgi:ATP-dependent helicase/nuclease subunit A